MKPLVLGTGLLSLAMASVITLAHAEFESCCGQPVRWGPSTVPIEYCTAFWSASDIQDITDAAYPWTAITDSGVSIVVGADNSCNTNNLDNEIWYDTGPNSNSYLAATFATYKDVSTGLNCNPAGSYCCGTNCEPSELIEADIVVYDKVAGGVNIPWQLGKPSGQNNDPTYGTSNQRPWFIVIMQHEMGHALGIQHTTNTAMARMSTFTDHGGWFYSGSTRVSLFGPDRFDARALYPGSGSYSDLYISNVQPGQFSCSGSWCGYLTRPLDFDVPTDTPLIYPRNTTPISSNTSRVQAGVGQKMEMKLCRGNLGGLPTAATTVTVYASPDRIWNSTDLNIGTVTVPALTARTGFCQNVVVEIPAGVPEGYYYLLLGYGSNNNHRIAVQPRTMRVVP